MNLENNSHNFFIKTLIYFSLFLFYFIYIYIYIFFFFEKLFDIFDNIENDF